MKQFVQLPAANSDIDSRTGYLIQQAGRETALRFASTAVKDVA
jgi:hypothetical protein